MDRRKGILAVLVIVIIVTATIFMWPEPADDRYNDRIYQVGTLDGLVQGDFSGKISVEMLLEHGDYGLGTFEGLDGEMIVIDGECYRVANDGSVNRVDGNMKTPFASVTDFDPSGKLVVHDFNYTSLKQEILANLYNDETFHIIIVHAMFWNITVRSVPGHSAPYPTLAEVLSEQSIYYLTNVTGTLIGLYAPPYVGTIDQVGFHFHFISDDRDLGGHVLDLGSEYAEISIEAKNGLDLDL